MKKVLLSLAIVAAAFGANAQKNATSKLKFSVGVEAAAPIGDFGDFSSFGIGGTAQADYWVAPELALTLQSGYIKFLEKNSNGLELGIIPVMAGIKYNFTPQLYGSAQLGTGIFTGGGNSESTFSYAPGIGYKFSDHVDALLKYTGYTKDSETSSTVGLRVAYTF
jgi:hypothetical protein